MHQNLEKLLQELTERAKHGASLEEQMVLRALRIPEIQEKLSSALDQGFSLVNAIPLPSAVPEVAQVLFQLHPPPGYASLKPPGFIGSFAVQGDAFLSVSEMIEITPPQGTMGALPLALAAPSFTQATALPDHDPTLRALNQRREAFTNFIVGSGSGSWWPPKPPGPTPPVPTRYQTQESTTFATKSETQVKVWKPGTTPNDGDEAIEYHTDWNNDERPDYRPDTD